MNDSTLFLTTKACMGRPVILWTAAGYLLCVVALVIDGARIIGALARLL